jgi:predicted Na+-dependent transporter
MLLRGLHAPAARLERPLALGSSLGLVGFMVSDSLARPSLSLDLFAESLAPVVWLAGAGVLLGFFVPRWLGQSTADAVTISVELCLRNILLGIVVVSISFTAFEPNIPLFVYSAVMIPPTILLLVLFRLRQRRARKA